MATRQKKVPTTYTYESVDGSKTTIQIGQDGVNEKWIAFLATDDAALREQDDYQRKHEDYGYQNAVTKYNHDPDSMAGHPMEQFADPTADIFRILYPDEEIDSPILSQVSSAMGKLKDEQLDLIYELYGLCRTVSEIARDQEVSRAAIQNRRTKIINRIKKIIDAQSD